VKVRCKNVCILINGAVLDNRFARFPYIDDLIEAAVKEIDLQVEGPSLHIFIEIVQVWIIVNVFKMGIPAVVFCQEISKGGFSGAYIAGDRNVHVEQFDL
jgi:hypothetical protein